MARDRPVALPQARHGVRLAAGRARAARVLADLLAKPPAPGSFYNVNLPHLRPDEADPEVVYCPLGPAPAPLLSYRHENDGGMHYDGDYHTRKRTAGADVDVCFSGRIAVTTIKLL